MKQVIHPVELLRDRKGTYGIGIAKDAQIDRPPSSILLRPDRLDGSYVIWGTIYQMITGGFRHGMFCHTREEWFRQVVHHEMLCRAGLPWPPPNGPDDQYPYWSNDKKQRSRNRQIYHGLRLRSLAVINNLIRNAIEEAAIPEAIIQARRFRFWHRENIYRKGATSLRALQLIETFPALALTIFCWNHMSAHVDQAREAGALVERGAPLKHIAQHMDVPMALRKVKPGGADLALAAIKHCAWDSRLVHAYMPDSLPRIKVWLRVVHFASELGPEFVEWAAKHAFQIAGSTTEILTFLSDTADWVRACYRSNVPSHIRRAILDNRFDGRGSQGEEFVTRPFSPDMSLGTVTRLSGEWHEAVANNMDGPSYRFPEPWCDGSTVGDYEIIPITNSADLYREGHAMHHCVGTYGDRVRHGGSYVYSVRKQTTRIATVELSKYGDRASLNHLRGPCNSQVPKEIERAVLKWLRSQKEFRFPEPPEDPFQRHLGIEFVGHGRGAAVVDDPEIPF